MAALADKSGGKTVSAKAMRVLEVLRRLQADCPERAIPDHTLAVEADVPKREVIELAEELAEIDVAVVAVCGKRDDGRRGKGRYETRDADVTDAYADGLHERGLSIMGREGRYRRLAERMRFGLTIESDGQRRLFA